MHGSCRGWWDGGLQAAAPQRQPGVLVLCFQWKKSGKIFFFFCVKEETRGKSCEQLQVPLSAAPMCWSAPGCPKLLAHCDSCILLS